MSFADMNTPRLPSELADVFVVSNDPSRIDFEFVHAYLAKSYWSPGLPKEILRRAIEGSLCFGGYLNGEQVAFARVVTDQATFAYLCDVFVAPQYHGRGFGNQLMAAIMAHPSLQGLRRFMLATRDAHALYAKHGFASPSRPETLMEILRPDIYLQQ